jgi:hypothetical protein
VSITSSLFLLNYLKQFHFNKNQQFVLIPRTAIFWFFVQCLSVKDGLTACLKIASQELRTTEGKTNRVAIRFICKKKLMYIWTLVRLFLYIHVYMKYKLLQLTMGLSSFLINGSSLQNHGTCMCFYAIQKHATEWLQRLLNVKKYWCKIILL